MSIAAVVDSSGWLEYFAGTSRVTLFGPAIEDYENLIVPTISIYEVVKKLRRESGDDTARQALEVMQLGRVVDLDQALAVQASQHQLPLADSIIYATALRYQATLWTQDEHFKDLPGVRFFSKQPV